MCAKRGTPPTVVFVGEAVDVDDGLLGDTVAAGVGAVDRAGVTDGFDDASVGDPAADASVGDANIAGGVVAEGT